MKRILLAVVLMGLLAGSAFADYGVWYGGYCPGPTYYYYRDPYCGPYYHSYYGPPAYYGPSYGFYYYHR